MVSSESVAAQACPSDVVMCSSSQEVIRLAAAGELVLGGAKYLNLGGGYLGRKDEIPGTDLYEIHVYKDSQDFRKQLQAGNIDKLQKFEKGVVGPEGSWLKKHGHTSAPDLPSSTNDQLRGVVTDEARRRGWLDKKGRINIRGPRLRDAIVTGMGKTGSLRYLGQLGGTLGVVGSFQSMLSIERLCQYDPDHDAC